MRIVAVLLTSVLALCVGAEPAHGASAKALVLYVSEDGNDAWSGGQVGSIPEKGIGPFATIARARDAIRERKSSGDLPEGGVVVEVLPGTYGLEQTLAFIEEDSGTEESPIVYRAEGGQEVRLIGGKVVPSFEPVSDPAILEQLDESARTHVVQVDLKALGIENFGSPGGGGMELFFNDKPMQLSRWPNDDFVRIKEVIGDDTFIVHGREGIRTGKWSFEEDRPARWVNEKDLWVHGYWFWDWSEQRHRVKTLDIEAKTIEVEPKYHGYGYRDGQWYYAFNLLSEIDTPGEWYVDRETSVVYFWPPSSAEDGLAMVSELPTLVTMENTSYVTLEGFTLEGTRSTVISVKGGNDSLIKACTIRNSGAGAISVAGGTHHGVVDCEIYEVGGSGISMSGGDRATLTPAGHFAENNHIYNYARIKRVYHAGIHLSGVGNRAAHNLIHDAPHMGMGFSGNEHVIEYNEIHNVCYESNDAGAIYCGRDWTQRGTVIRYNYMHDINGFEDRGCVGVYLDDMWSGTEISGNLFYKVYRAAFIGGGRDCLVENNFFVDCPKALHIDARAMGWAASTIPTTMKDRLDAMPFRNELWSKRYPELLTVWQDEPAAPKGNVIRRNVFVGEDWRDIEDKAAPYLTMKDNLSDTDPLFEHPERVGEGKNPRPADFALKANSPAFAVGFEALPLEKMGKR